MFTIGLAKSVDKYFLLSYGKTVTIFLSFSYLASMLAIILAPEEIPTPIPKSKAIFLDIFIASSSFIRKILDIFSFFTILGIKSSPIPSIL